MIRMSDPDATEPGLESQHSAVTDGGASSEVRLVHAARLGDQQAFQQLVLRYERRVFQGIHRFVTDQEIGRAHV